MIEIGANPKDQEGWIMRAAVTHSIEKLQHFEAMGLEIKPERNGLLNRATENDASIEMMEYLLSKGQILQDKEEYDCLETATEQGHLSKVEFLLSKGANPNFSKDILLTAIKKENNEIAKTLLRGGADPTLDNDHALTDTIFSQNAELTTYLIAEHKMPVRQETRQIIEDRKHFDTFGLAHDLIKKRDLLEKLQTNLTTPKPTAIPTKQDFKRKI